jgi:hypothetical protein
MSDDASKPADAKPQVRLFVEGAYCPGCASVLTDALKQGGLKQPSKIAPNRGRGYVIVLGELGHDADLSKVAATVNEALTPHRELAAPGVALELFARLDEKSAAAALKALDGVEGVDAKKSTADAKRGVIGVSLTGKGKVSVSSLVGQLKEAGIEATVKTD